MPFDMRQTDRQPAPTAGRLVRLLIPVGLAVVLFALVLWPGLAFNASGDPFRLSTIRGYKAFNPDIAAAGGYVAAVWSEGYDTDADTKQYGRVYLKSAEEIGGWEARIEVFNATSASWGRDPRLVFDPTDPTSSKVHVVWAEASGCSTECDWSLIKRTTCYLDSEDRCDPPTTVATGLDEPSTPDLAVDNGGNVHVVWREGPEDAPGPIRYCMNSCGASPGNTGNIGQHPALAFSDGYLHLVWDTSSDDNSTIRYVRDASPGDGNWIGGDLQTWWGVPVFPSDYHEPSYPDVGASGSAVYVVWAVQRKTDPARYGLAFDFSQNNGGDWLPTFGFGRSIPENEINDFTTTWFAVDQAADDKYGLQPDVVVTGSGTSAYAHVVWHGRQYSPSKYNVWYSYLAGYDYGDPGKDWEDPTPVWADTSRDRGLPALAIGAAPTQTHVAFVEDVNASFFSRFDVWYVGSNDNRDNDTDAGEGIHFMPLIMKNAQY